MIRAVGVPGHTPIYLQPCNKPFLAHSTNSQVVVHQRKLVISSRSLVTAARCPHHTPFTPLSNTMLNDPGVAENLVERYPLLGIKDEELESVNGLLPPKDCRITYSVDEVFRFSAHKRRNGHICAGNSSLRNDRGIFEWCCDTG